MEEGVPATDIRAERVLHSHAVAEVDAVRVARPSAIRVVRAVREERGKDAVLHVKHRHVQMNRQFEPIRRSSIQERQDLREIQIVRDRHPFEAHLVKHGSRHRIGHVQRKVPDPSERALRKMGNASDIADEDAIRRGVLDELKKSFLSGFLNARGRKKNLRRSGLTNDRHGLLVSPDVFVIGSDLGDSAFQRSAELLVRAAEHQERW